MDQQQVLIGVAAPAGVAAVVLGAVWLGLPRALGKKRGSAGDGPRWALPALVGGLTLFGAYAFQSRVELWSDIATHRFPALGIAAAIAGLLAWVPFVHRRWWALASVAALGGAFAAWMFLSTVHPDFLSETVRWAWVGVVGVVTGVNAWSLERVGERLKGFRGPALMWALVGTVGLGATAGFANAPLIIGGAAAAFAALAVIGLVAPGVSIARGGATAAAVLLSGLVAFSNWLGDTERWVMLGLLLAAPSGVLLALAAWRPLKLGERRNLALAVAAAPALALAGTQAALTLPGLIASQSSGGDDAYYDY